MSQPVHIPYKPTTAADKAESDRYAAMALAALKGAKVGVTPTVPKTSAAQNALKDKQNTVPVSNAASIQKAESDRLAAQAAAYSNGYVDPQFKKTASPTTAAPRSSSNMGGGGVGGGSAAPSGMSTLDTLYNTLTGSVNAANTENQGYYDAALKAITGNYDQASQGMYQQYQGSRDTLEGGAANLGVDYDASQMGKDWDVALRRLQETGDLAKASDLSFVNKMKTLGGQAFQGLLSGIANDKTQRQADLVAAAQAAALARSRAASASRRSGGGSSSGSTKATETQTVTNPQDAATLALLRQTDPKAADLFQASLYRAAGGATGGLQSALDDYLANNNTDPTVKNQSLTAAQKAEAGRYQGQAAQVAKKGASPIINALAAAAAGSGVLNQPKRTISVVTKG